MASSSLPITSHLILFLGTLAQVAIALVIFFIVVATWVLSNIPLDVTLSTLILGVCVWWLVRSSLALNRFVPGVLPYLLGRRQGRNTTRKGNGGFHGD